MLDVFLQNQAALYATGALLADEREQLELVMEFHDELRAFVARLTEIGAAVTRVALPPSRPAPSPALRSRVAALIATRAQQLHPEGLVVSGADRRVQWINPAFSAMCGYSLEELRGWSLGPILQGEKTDAATAERMRLAVHDARPCRETILNYHKNGTPYWVEVAITPIRNDTGDLLWFIARERELHDRHAP